MQQARQLGRYQLLDRVAFGGMAEIYRAKTADAEGRLHLVAVKRVLSHLCEDDEFIQMLVDEAKITASLQHENIARIYEFCRTDREYFIAMEYVDGKDVRALLEKARQNQEMLPEEHIAWIGLHTARALHAAHTQRDREGRPLRIVHRDVSPSNILLSYRGEVKLCDFGIAKATLTRVQTKTGVIKGKVKYMSPEQAMGRKLDHRSDLFSLGTLLYEMLTLQAPFQAPTEIELIFAVRDARKRPVRELRPDVNPVLEDIVDRAMARSRSQRFQSGEELAQALESFLREFYGDFRRSTFGRYMRNTFSREIERELRMLEEFVIDGGRADEVGENLLADVLGPNAPYTQFTAAFNDGAQDGGTGGVVGRASAPGSVDLGDMQTGPTPLSRMARPEGAAAGGAAPRATLRRNLDAGWGLDSPVDGAKARGLPVASPARAATGVGSRLTQPPAGAASPQPAPGTPVEAAPEVPGDPLRPAGGPRVTAMGRPLDFQALRPAAAQRPLRTEVAPPLADDDGLETADGGADAASGPMTTDPLLGDGTDLPVEQTQIDREARSAAVEGRGARGGAGPFSTDRAGAAQGNYGDDGADDGGPADEPGDLHAEQTRIISREAVGLHDAATRIFDVRKLPPDMQSLLSGVLGRPEAGGARLPSVSVAPQLAERLGGAAPLPPQPMSLAHDVNLHDAETMFLQRAAVDQLGVSPEDLRSPPKVEATAQVRLPGSGERRGEQFSPEEATAQRQKARPQDVARPALADPGEATGPRLRPDAPEPSVILDDSDLLVE